MFELSTRWLEGAPDWRFTVERFGSLPPAGPQAGAPRVRWKASWDDDLDLMNAALRLERPSASVFFGFNESTDSFDGLFRPVKGSFGSDEAESVEVRLNGAESSLLALYRSRIPNPGEDGALFAVQMTGAPASRGARARINQIWVDSGPVPRVRRPKTDPTPYVSETARRFTSFEVDWEGDGTMREWEWGFARVTGFDRDWDGVERTASHAVAMAMRLERRAWSVDASWRAAAPKFASPATDDHEVKRDRRAAAVAVGSERFDPWSWRVTRNFRSAYDGTEPTYGWKLATEYDRGRGETRRQIGVTFEWDEEEASVPEIELEGRYGVWKATVRADVPYGSPVSPTVRVELPIRRDVELRVAHSAEDRLNRIELVVERRSLAVRIVAKRRLRSPSRYLHGEVSLKWGDDRTLTARFAPWDRGHLDWHWATPADVELGFRQAF